ncbi:complement C1r-A subcomponent [Chanos chanos]|uniref:complement subcomponent C1r n=1 Tax=Chanos chanos TaxID=29144 RepID=A0A6J2W647_CHACN|nr:complement C1r-A subcomponent-like [Chanos chanos]
MMGWRRIICVLYVCVSVCFCEPALYGEVNSPSYPKGYPGDLYVQWELEVPKGYRIQLTFNHMDVEPSDNCFYDSVTVLYGQKILGKYCGQDNSANGRHPGKEPILSPGNHLQLVFQTDGSNAGSQQHLGFSAFYQAVDVDECSSPNPEDESGPLCSQICLNTVGSYLCACNHGYQLRPDQRTCVLHCGGGVFTEPQGILSSPGYPDPSPLDQDCHYNITVEPGFIITLNFSGDFQIEQIDDNGPTCLYHWLKVSVPGKEPKKLCGDQSPGLYHTESNSVQLEYHTDWHGLSRGWNLHYTTHRVACGSPQKIANGRVTPDFSEYLYRDYIQVRCDTGYKLMLNGREISSFMSMCKSDGQWHRTLPECHIIDCGEPKPLLNGGVRFLAGSNNEFRSVIQYHCNEPYYTFPGAQNLRYTCDADRKWKESDHNDIIPPCLPVCGHPIGIPGSHQRVLGGKNAPAETFPWQVLLSTTGRGGAIVIGEQWIMTAAHNLKSGSGVTPKESVKLYVGHNDVKVRLESTPLEIASIHIHPQYQGNNNFDNDIALIKLARPLTFNSEVQPLCLPPEGAKYERSGWVSGFGYTEEMSISNELRYIVLPLVDQTECRNSFERLKQENIPVMPFTGNMFCAGLPEGGADTCSGDSGSAFVLKDRESDRYWVGGIVSWGVQCGEKGRYGVYTRVSHYVGWINTVMGEH